MTNLNRESDPGSREWIALKHPRDVFESMLPKTIRFDEKHIGLPEASDVTVCFDGDDDRQPLKRSLVAPNRWVCKLQVAYFDHETTTVSYTEGSGLLIGDRYVLTAAHVLMDDVRDNDKNFLRAIDAAAIVVIPGLDGRFRDRRPTRMMPFGWTRGDEFRMHSAYRDSMQKTGVPPAPLDYAVIRLTEPIGAKQFKNLGGGRLGYWGEPRQRGLTRIRGLRAHKLRNAKVNSVGYPGDKCLNRPQARVITAAEVAACRPADRGSVPWYSFDRIREIGPDPVPFDQITFDHDVAPGMSGGPVWLRWRRVRTLIGINHACSVDKSGIVLSSSATRITDTVIRDIRNWTI